MTKISFNLSFAKKQAVDKEVSGRALVVALASGRLLPILSPSPVSRPGSLPCGGGCQRPTHSRFRPPAFQQAILYAAVCQAWRRT